MWIGVENQTDFWNDPMSLESLNAEEAFRLVMLHYVIQRGDHITIDSLMRIQI
jgi:hypothetical protein